MNKQAEKEFWDRMISSRKFTNEQNLCIENAKKQELTEEQIGLISNPSLSPEQMNEITEGFLCGLSLDQISIYANSELSVNSMKTIRQAAMQGATKQTIMELNKTFSNLSSAILFFVKDKVDIQANEIEAQQGKLNRKDIDKKTYVLIDDITVQVENLINNKIEELCNSLTNEITNKKKGIDERINGARVSINKNSPDSLSKSYTKTERDMEY